MTFGLKEAFSFYPGSTPVANPLVCMYTVSPSMSVQTCVPCSPSSLFLLARPSRQPSFLSSHGRNFSSLFQRPPHLARDSNSVWLHYHRRHDERLSAQPRYQRPSLPPSSSSPALPPLSSLSFPSSSGASPPGSSASDTPQALRSVGNATSSASCPLFSTSPSSSSSSSPWVLSSSSPRLLPSRLPSPPSCLPLSFSSSCSPPSLLSFPLDLFVSRRFYRHWSRHRSFDKIRRLPNKALRPGRCAGSLFSSSPHAIGDAPSVHGDFSLARSSNGGFLLMPPYPPRTNKTIEPYPPSASRFFQLHRNYKLQWKNIEYRYTPQLQPRPWGREGMWGGSLIRIFHQHQRRGGEGRGKQKAQKKTGTPP